MNSNHNNKTSTLSANKCWCLKSNTVILPKNWCFQIVVLEKTLESTLDSKEIKSVNPKGNQPWVFIGKTDAEALILWPHDAKSWPTGKDPDAGKDWVQEGKGATKDETVGWHCRLSGHEFEQAPRDSEGQGSLACCSSWGCKVSDMTELLNNKTNVLEEGDSDFSIVCSCSAANSCPTLCDLMNCSMPGFPVLHSIPKFAHTYILWVSDTI